MDFEPCNMTEYCGDDFPGAVTQGPTESFQQRVADWNAVATVHKGQFRRACRILEEFGDVRRTNFYNVVVVTADDPRGMLAGITRRAGEQPALLLCIARLMPLDVTFNFFSTEEFEVKAREEALLWAPRLAGKSFHVRLHRRGFKGRLSTPAEERFLDDALLAALAAAESPGEIAFDDSDAVIDVETVDNRAGMALWMREELMGNPFLRVD